MDEDQKTLRRGFRQKEVEMIAWLRTIRNGGSGSFTEGSREKPPPPASIDAEMFRRRG